MADSLSELSVQAPYDADAQATITDFLDYTEFFPSDLFRSLTLIGKLDHGYIQDSSAIHNLTKTYNHLPNLHPAERPNPRNLRKDISTTLDHALRYRESSYAEASRLCNVADNLYDRLVGIQKKLKALPLPPSREPTPPPKLRSPVNSRRKPDAPRFSLFGDSGPHNAVSLNPHGAQKQKNRVRRVIVPGEVLPPFDANSPGPSIGSDSDSDIASSPVHQESAPLIKLKPPKEKIKPFKIDKTKATPNPRVRPPGVMGTNVHSTVAGISVSNAMAALTPPPFDPAPGSEWAPWNELTVWELNLLRRRMKKNANWRPSDIMMARELSGRNRGVEAKRRAKSHAEVTGTQFLDQKAHTSDRSAQTVTPTESIEKIDTELNMELINRGMKLNEKKKLKQQRLKEEAAQQQSEMPEQDEMSYLDKIISNAGRAVAQLYRGGTATDPAKVAATIRTEEPAEKTKKTPKKRKRSPSIAAEDFVDPVIMARVDQTEPKKIKLHVPTVDESKANNASNVQPNGKATSIRIPLAAEGPSTPEAKPKPTKPATKFGTASTRSARAAMPTNAAPAPVAVSSSKVAKKGTLQHPIMPKHSMSHGSLALRLPKSKADSVEPVKRRVSDRHSRAVAPAEQTSSAIDDDNDFAPRPTGRRGRAASSTLSSSITQITPKAAIIKAKPTSGRKEALQEKDEMNAMLLDEDIDPEEPRYCVCNNVSWGDMIECSMAESNQCPKVWFHLPCVGLTEIPGRREKWFCPDCRLRLKITASGVPLKGKKQ